MRLNNAFQLLAKHAGKILWLPMLTNMATFAGNILVAISDDGWIDEQEFHTLIQGGSSLQMLVLMIVMVLLKLNNVKKP